jgi:hypothetical protein
MVWSEAPSGVCWSIFLTRCGIWRVVGAAPAVLQTTVYRPPATLVLGIASEA